MGLQWPHYVEVHCYGNKMNIPKKCDYCENDATNFCIIASQYSMTFLVELSKSMNNIYTTYSGCDEHSTLFDPDLLKSLRVHNVVHMFRSREEFEVFSIMSQ